MELKELIARYDKAKSSEETYVILNMIKGVAEEGMEMLKESFSKEEPRSVVFDDLGKVFNIVEINKGKLHADEIKEKLSDAEIRMVYKPTDKDLQLLKRDDLRELKDFELQKQIRVTSMQSST